MKLIVEVYFDELDSKNLNIETSELPYMMERAVDKTGLAVNRTYWINENSSDDLTRQKALDQRDAMCLLNRFNRNLLHELVVSEIETIHDTKDSLEDIDDVNVYLHHKYNRYLTHPVGCELLTFDDSFVNYKLGHYNRKPCVSVNVSGIKYAVITLDQLFHVVDTEFPNFVYLQYDTYLMITKEHADKLIREHQEQYSQKIKEVK